MKRWNIDAPANSQYTEHPDGEWVRYEDLVGVGRDDDPVVDEPAWLRNEVRRLRGVLRVWSAVHGHNVKLKAKLEASELNERTEACNAEALRAEVERLRAEHLESQRNGAAVAVQLAAAHALLLQTTDGDTVTEGWKRRRDAYLAAQPATAPTRPFCQACVSMVEKGHTCSKPTRTEDSYAVRAR